MSEHPRPSRETSCPRRVCVPTLTPGWLSCYFWMLFLPVHVIRRVWSVHSQLIIQVGFIWFWLPRIQYNTYNYTSLQVSFLVYPWGCERWSHGDCTCSILRNCPSVCQSDHIALHPHLRFLRALVSPPATSQGLPSCTFRGTDVLVGCSSVSCSFGLLFLLRWLMIPSISLWVFTPLLFL